MLMELAKVVKDAILDVEASWMKEEEEGNSIPV